MFLFERYKSPCLRLGGSIVLLLCLLDVREIKRQSLFVNHALLYLETKGALSESIQNAFLLAYFYHLLFELILGNFDQGRLRGPSVHGRLSSWKSSTSLLWSLMSWFDSMRDEKMRRKFTIMKQISTLPTFVYVYHSIYMCLLFIVLGMVMSQSWWLTVVSAKIIIAFRVPGCCRLL